MVDEANVTYLTPQQEGLPDEFQSRSLRKRVLQALLALGVLVAIFILAPGLGEVRDLLVKANPWWLVLGVALEGLSYVSYILMFGPIFCTGLTRSRSWQIGGSELAMGSLVPASGAGGLALGAWVLHRGGMEGERIARRSVAFFLIKSSVNFFAVSLIGAALAIGLFGPDLHLWLTALPAVVSAVVIVAVGALPRLGPGEPPKLSDSRPRRWFAVARKAMIEGTAEARQILGTGNPAVIAGAIGYWLFDNLVLWATFHAFGTSPPMTVILMGYLIGQMGGLLPIPGGIGGIDLGLIGTLVVYGTPAAPTAAAVLAYRIILFWLPLIAGGVAFGLLRRDMPSGDEFAACAPALAGQSA